MLKQNKQRECPYGQTRNKKHTYIDYRCLFCTYALSAKQATIMQYI